MLRATLVSSEDELRQIYALNRQNLRSALSADEIAGQGFVTWLYTVPLLQKLHRLAPSVIVKDENKVAGYALATLKEASALHPDLRNMINQLETIPYGGKPLTAYRYYCMGQICIDKAYRGKGLVNALYQHHKKVYGSRYELLVTEISTANPRSLKAHQNIGFKVIHSHSDAVDEWNVVVWDWR